MRARWSFIWILILGGIAWGAAIQPGEATAYFWKALAAYDKGNWDASKTLVELALEREPNFQEADWLAALVATRQEVVDRAAALRERASRAQARIPGEAHERLAREIQSLSARTERLATARSVWESHDEPGALAARRFSAAFDAAYPRISSALGVALSTPVIATVASAGETWKAWTLPWWLSPLDQRDGRLRMSAADPAPETSEGRLRHQMVHALLHAPGSRKALPRWFEEGLAEYYAKDTGDPSGGGLTEDRNRLHGAPLLSAARLEEVFRSRDADPGDRHLAWIEARALVAAMAQKGGEALLRRLVDAGPNAFDKALKEESRQEMADWIAALQ